MAHKKPQPQKKRTAGVIAFGVVTILLPFLSLAGIDIKEPFIMYREPWGSNLYLASMPMAIYEITLGVSILRLQDWARRSLLVLSSIYLALTAALPFVARDSFWIYFNGKLGANLATGGTKNVVFFFTSYMLWYVSLIFYFSTPYVRWQFWVSSQKNPPKPTSKHPLPF